MMTKTKPEPLVVRPNDAMAMLGNCSKAELYRKIAAGELVSYLDGPMRRLITVESIKADIARRIAAAAAGGFQRGYHPTRQRPARQGAS
jgi:hypothetical protein